MKTQPEIRLFTFPGHHNLINLDLDDIPLIVLIDTYAHISDVPEPPYLTKKKVVTPVLVQLWLLLGCVLPVSLFLP